MTKGEKLFEEYCKSNSLKYEKIMETPKEKTPDYKLFLPNEKFIIFEIKDLDDNSEDQSALEKYKNDGWAVWNSSKPGARIRNKINDAKKQLKKYANLNRPLILIIYDNRNYITPEINEYDIAVGMYGLEKRNVSDSGIIKSHGPQKKMTAQEKTYISYIGMLNKSSISLYENFYTPNKLTSEERKWMNISCTYFYKENPDKTFGWTNTQ